MGIATTAAAAGAADLVSGGRQGLDPHRILDVLHLVPAAAVLATAVTGLHLFFLTVPQVRRPRAGVVVVLGAAAAVGCLTAAGVVAAVRGAHRRLRPVVDRRVRVQARAVRSRS